MKRAPRALLSWTLTAFLAFAVLFMAPLGKWGTIACMVIGAMSVLRAYAAARLAGFFDHEEPRSPDAPGSSAHLRVVTPEEAQEEAIRAAERRDSRDPDEWIEEQARRFEEENDDEEDEKKRRR